MAETLFRPLFAWPVDVVGDVHGEVEALGRLLWRLGYSSEGVHPERRRLVFVGDLTDRGPDSPAVVALIRGLVEAGRAQCVLGNHEFNILAWRPKTELSWLCDDVPPFRHQGVIVPQAKAEGRGREEILAFFRTLPLALERADLRVVHACWDAGMVERVRHESDVVRLYEQYRAAIEDDLRREGVGDELERTLAYQNRNPVKLLTSGPEESSPAAWELNGKERFERRVAWWEGYRDAELCLFGHYWRTTLPGEEPVERLFDDTAPDETLGPGPAMCIDYSVGKRYRERLAEGFAGTFRCQLAALRLPERVLFFDTEPGGSPLVRRRAPDDQGPKVAP